jgi:hypothetical protein
MRNVCLKALALVVTLSAGLAARSEAQTVTTLIDWTDSWRYDQSGRELGTTWRQNSYVPDAQWGPLSPGLLGFEPDTPQVYTVYAPISTPLNISTVVTTYYFRTTFTYPGGTTTGLSVVATNLVDDGCVAYLNGTEVGRIRVATGQNATTLSTGAFTEGQLDVFTITNLALLRTGPNANVMAVELHQSANTSSDAMYGMKLVTVRATQLMITSQPQSQTVSAGDSVSFTVEVSGGPAFYRWFKDGVFQSGGTNATFNINSVQTGNAGGYNVIVTNSISSVTSVVATLTVVPDTKGPDLVDAVGETNTVPGVQIINISFTEPLNRDSATNLNNYVIYAGTNFSSKVTFTNAQYAFTDKPRVFLRGMSGANWSFGSNYFVQVNKVADLKGNNIDPNSIIPVSWQIQTNLLQGSDTWNYYDNAFFDPTFPAIYHSLDWASTNYVMDSLIWAGGGGIFARVTGSAILTCAGDTVGTDLSFQLTPTLFRKQVLVSTNLFNAGSARSVVLRMRYIVDDGLVVFLNGREIFRTANMANVNILTENARATTTVGDAACVTNTPITVTNLHGGTNWFAAGVYQSTTDQADTVFGLEIESTFLRTSPAPAVPALSSYPLTMTRQDPNVALSWPSNWYGFKLETTTSLRGTGSGTAWQQVSNQANPYIFNPSAGDPARFYRLNGTK